MEDDLWLKKCMNIFYLRGVVVQINFNFLIIQKKEYCSEMPIDKSEIHQDSGNCLGFHQSLLPKALILRFKILLDTLIFDPYDTIFTKKFLIYTKNKLRECIQLHLQDIFPSGVVENYQYENEETLYKFCINHHVYLKKFTENFTNENNIVNVKYPLILQEKKGVDQCSLNYKGVIKILRDILRKKFHRKVAKYFRNSLRMKNLKKLRAYLFRKITGNNSKIALFKKYAERLAIENIHFQLTSKKHKRKRLLTKFIIKNNFFRKSVNPFAMLLKDAKDINKQNLFQKERVLSKVEVFRKFLSKKIFLFKQGLKKKYKMNKPKDIFLTMAFDIMITYNNIGNPVIQLNRFIKRSLKIPKLYEVVNLQGSYLFHIKSKDEKSNVKKSAPKVIFASKKEDNFGKRWPSFLKKFKYIREVSYRNFYRILKYQICPLDIIKKKIKNRYQNIIEKHFLRYHKNVHVSKGIPNLKELISLPTKTNIICTKQFSVFKKVIYKKNIINSLGFNVFSRLFTKELFPFDSTMCTLNFIKSHVNHLHIKKDMPYENYIHLGTKLVPALNLLIDGSSKCKGKFSKNYFKKVMIITNKKLLKLEERFQNVCSTISRMYIRTVLFLIGVKYNTILRTLKKNVLADKNNIQQFEVSRINIRKIINFIINIFIKNVLPNCIKLTNRKEKLWIKHDFSENKDTIENTLNELSESSYLNASEETSEISSEITSNNMSECFSERVPESTSRSRSGSILDSITEKESESTSKGILNSQDMSECSIESKSKSISDATIENTSEVTAESTSNDTSVSSSDGIVESISEGSEVSSGGSSESISDVSNYISDKSDSVSEGSLEGYNLNITLKEISDTSSESTISNATEFTLDSSSEFTPKGSSDSVSDSSSDTTSESTSNGIDKSESASDGKPTSNSISEGSTELRKDSLDMISDTMSESKPHGILEGISGDALKRSIRSPFTEENLSKSTSAKPRLSSEKYFENKDIYSECAIDVETTKRSDLSVFNIYNKKKETETFHLMFTQKPSEIILIINFISFVNKVMNLMLSLKNKISDFRKQCQYSMSTISSMVKKLFIIPDEEKASFIDKLYQSENLSSEKLKQIIEETEPIYMLQTSNISQETNSTDNQDTNYFLLSTSDFIESRKTMLEIVQQLIRVSCEISNSVKEQYINIYPHSAEFCNKAIEIKLENISQVPKNIFYSLLFFLFFNLQRLKKKAHCLTYFDSKPNKFLKMQKKILQILKIVIKSLIDFVQDPEILNISCCQSELGQTSESLKLSPAIIQNSSRLLTEVDSIFKNISASVLKMFTIESLQKEPVIIPLHLCRILSERILSSSSIFEASPNEDNKNDLNVSAICRETKHQNSDKSYVITTRDEYDDDEHDTNSLFIKIIYINLGLVKGSLVENIQHFLIVPIDLGETFNQNSKPYCDELVSLVSDGQITNEIKIVRNSVIKHKPMVNKFKFHNCIRNVRLWLKQIGHKTKVDLTHGLCKRFILTEFIEIVPKFVKHIFLK